MDRIKVIKASQIFFFEGPPRLRSQTLRLPPLGLLLENNNKQTESALTALSKQWILIHAIATGHALFNLYSAQWVIQNTASIIGNIIL